MMYILIGSPKASLCFPIDYFEQLGSLVRYGQYEFGVFGQKAHDAWERSTIVGELSMARVYLDSQCVKEIRGSALIDSPTTEISVGV